MIHIRIDQNELNIHRKFACGIGPELPPSDQWFYHTEYHAIKADCPICNPGGPKLIGVPASSMDGNAANAAANPEAWNRWVAFSEACGGL